MEGRGWIVTTREDRGYEEGWDENQAHRSGVRTTKGGLLFNDTWGGDRVHNHNRALLPLYYTP